MRKLLLVHFSLLAFSCLIAQPTTGLVGYFNFNNNLTNTGSATISATNNSVTYGTDSTGTINRALQFNGTVNSYVSISDNGNLDFTGDFTISLAVYLTSRTASQGILDNCLNYGGYGLFYFNGDTSFHFNFRNASIGSIKTTTNRWKAITIQRNSNTLKIYENGVLTSSGNIGTTPPAYNYPIVLGQMFYSTISANGNYNPISNGSKIDEIRFYNRALSDAEIASLTPYTLPTSLQQFKAVLNNNMATISWELENNYNLKKIEIQQSIDGINFNKIASIDAISNLNKYSYLDKSVVNINASIIYYRLVEINEDGSFKYSNVIQIHKNLNNNGLQVYPNPVKYNANINIKVLKNSTANLQLFDNLGKQFINKSIDLQKGQNSFNLNINGIKKGIYVLKIIGNEINEFKQVVIE